MLMMMMNDDDDDDEDEDDEGDEDDDGGVGGYSSRGFPISMLWLLTQLCRFHGEASEPPV